MNAEAKQVLETPLLVAKPWDTHMQHKACKELVPFFTGYCFCGQTQDDLLFH